MGDVACWLESSLRRVYPKSSAQIRSSLTLHAARNDRVSFQVCVRNASREKEAKAEITVASPDELAVEVRRVGYVPQMHLNTETPENELDGIRHVPGLVPDPLYPEHAVTLGPDETHAFRVDVDVHNEGSTGVKNISISVVTGDERSTLTTRISVHSLVIAPRKDFIVGHWFYADALCDRYKLSPYEERFWQVVEPYMADYMAHGNDTMFVPHLTPPINGEHRPHQLLKVSRDAEGGYAFDFSDIRRWVRTARSHGAKNFFWSHLFTQWGAKSAARVYRDNLDPNSLLWPKETEATSQTYRGFLKQYMPRLHEFLMNEGLLDRSFSQISDEPFGDEHLENYRKAQSMVREIAPWIRTMDGLSDVRFSKEGLCDMPISGLHASPKFRDESIPHCVYYCCGPRGRFINRLLDTPLIKIRMSGWLFYKLGASGFMHWGYNYWYKGCTSEMIDPFREQAMGEWSFIPYGDPFVVYPGADGPIDSIRWEAFAEGIRDIALLQSAGITPDDPMLSPLQGYDQFPKTEEWLVRARSEVLKRSAV